MATRLRLSVIVRRLFISHSSFKLSPHSYQSPCQPWAARGDAAPINASTQITGQSPFAQGQHAVRPRCLSRIGLAACCAVATSLFAVHSPCAAQTPLDPPKDQSGPLRSPENQPVPSVQYPDAASALGAFKTVSAWARKGNIPKTPPATGIPSAPASAVSLRFLGEVVGRGTDASGGPTTLWRSASLAIAEAEKKLPVGAGADALEEKRRAEVLRELTVSIEIAGSLVPLRAATYDEIDASVNLGVEGIAVRVGEKTLAIFPASMIVQGTSPGDAAASLVGSVLNDPSKGLRADPEAQPAKLTLRDGVAFYKFASAHIVQQSATGLPQFATRGGHLVPEGDMTAKAMREFASGLAGHLMGRLWPGPEQFGLRGNMRLTTAQHDPQIAPPAEQAMIALSLRRYSGTKGVPTVEAARAFAACDDVSEKLANVEKGEREPWGDPLSSMMFLAALDQRCYDVDFKPSEKLAQAAEECAKAGILAQTAPQLEGLKALAWQSACDKSDPGAAKKMGGEVITKLLEQQLDADLATHMPWLAIASRSAGGGTPAQDHARRLRSFRELAYTYVLSPADAGDENQDLVGGMVFPGSRSPLPSAQSARVIAGLAAMLGDPAVTPKEEFGKELVRLLPCLRFLRQLAVDDSSAWMCQNLPKVKWGVRGYAWDTRLPGEASALTLIALSETLDAIEKRSKE